VTVQPNTEPTHCGSDDWNANQFRTSKQFPAVF